MYSSSVYILGIKQNLILRTTNNTLITKKMITKIPIMALLFAKDLDMLMIRTSILMPKHR